jgi:DNA-binding transcriptional MerR regulator
MDKSPDAFRTISEVADHLETPAHVLRFWESRFPQIRPVKRAGGRRYYRPSDVALLTGIKRLLHDEGLTIRGVQKILRDHGVRHVAGLTEDGPALDDILAAPNGVDLATKDDLEDQDDVVYLDDHRDAPAMPPDAPEDIPEAAFIAVEDDDQDFAPPTPVQAVLPLFDTPAPKPVPVLRKPTIRDDATFASQIRALSPGHFARSRPEVAALARRLSALRSRMANRADGSGV